MGRSMLECRSCGGASGGVLCHTCGVVGNQGGIMKWMASGARAY